VAADLTGPGEEAATPGPEEAAARRTVTVAVPRLWWRTLAIVILLVAMGVALFAQWRRAEDLAAEAADRRAITKAAATLGTALMSYDFEHLDRAERAVLAVSTKKFAAKYKEAFGAGLQPIITRLQATATASVGRVYVTEIKGSSARAVVVLDSEVRSATGLRRLDDSYLEMGLRRERGKWRIDDVTAVAAAGENVTPPPSEPAPSDPAPPAEPAPGGSG
jgi:Mce-associated membrane protein